MAKYRVLSLEELKELEKEFIEYLVLNGIEANDWDRLKRDLPQDAEKVIELFSDVVFEKIMRDTRFLEWRDVSELRSLQCLEDRFVVVGMNLSDVENADLTNPQYVRDALANPPSDIQVYTTEIKYDKSREHEIFELLERGYQKSDGKLFKTICLTLPS